MPTENTLDPTTDTIYTITIDLGTDDDVIFGKPTFKQITSPSLTEASSAAASYALSLDAISTLSGYHSSSSDYRKDWMAIRWVELRSRIAQYILDNDWDVFPLDSMWDVRVSLTTTSVAEDEEKKVALAKLTLREQQLLGLV